ncbi:MAG TPA: XrtA system polysaccharide deacetylase [Azospirillum sp.]|nr:XrtA system polysaccharide deacetylase [Azospirillum sp.]
MTEQALARPAPAADRVVNALSVDVEDYYQVSAFAGVVDRASWDRWPSRVVDNTLRTLDLFAESGVRATFFTLGCVAQAHPRLVATIAAAGHEVASHGFSHRRVGEQTPRAFRDDVVATKALLEDQSGAPVRGYRAASFSIDRGTWWAFDVLAEAGYAYSSSIHPIAHDHYGVPDAPRHPFRPAAPDLMEIPVATVELLGRRWSCGGGGFFRVLPYGWTRGAVARINAREGRPATFYFHPWEIDPDQPRVSGAPMKARLRHYSGLSGMADKLRRLLRDFAWDRIDAVHAGALRRGPGDAASGS